MVTVIVPVLNESEFLPQLLERLRVLGAKDVIIVDGGSDDGTPDLAKGKAKIVVSERGRARQMNAGAIEAKGDILLFLHADTELPEGAFDLIEKEMADPKVVGGRFGVKLDNPRFIFRLIGAMINLRDAIFGGYTGDQAIFVRREVFEALGGYRDIPLMEDLDLARRLRRFGRAVRLRAKVTTSARRWEKEGIAKTIALMWFLRLAYLLGVDPARLAHLYGNAR